MTRAEANAVVWRAMEKRGPIPHLEEALRLLKIDPARFEVLREEARRKERHLREELAPTDRLALAPHDLGDGVED